jgi:hypothetical protein
MRLLAKE